MRKMARGRGRGRGRGRKTAILTVGSSVGARVEPFGLHTQEKSQNEEGKFEDGVSVGSTGPKKLNVIDSMEKEEEYKTQN